MKEINGEIVDEKEIEGFLKEAEVMRALAPHPNVLKFIGICRRPFCLVTGLLQKYLLSLF